MTVVPHRAVREEVLSIYLVLTPRVLMLDYAGPAEALRMASEMGAALRLHTCAPQARIRTSLGTSIDGLSPLPRTLPPHSMVLVVGSANEAVDYATPLAQRVVRWLQAAPRADTRLASICSGALLLAKAGYLEGRRCTTHHALMQDLLQEAPTAQLAQDRIFVEDGRLLTSAGITTGIDMALYIIEQVAGAALAAQVARRLVVYQRRGTHDVQLSPWLAHRNHMHAAVHRAQDAIARDPGHAWTLTALAQVACVSPRHLSRVFAQHAGLSVAAYQQQLRIARAQELQAQHPTWSQEQLAQACGFGSARDFRRVWRRHAPSTTESAAKAQSLPPD